MRPAPLLALATALLLLVVAGATTRAAPLEPPVAPHPAATPRPAATFPPMPATAAAPGSTDGPQAPAVAWRSSRALGLPFRDGRLRRGVLLPSWGEHHFTWDSALKVTPSRAWRRWGTDTLVRTVLDVAAAHRTAHPDAPRMGVGDLSRPRGGIFDRRFGGLGHASHQNGLDADVYYPRRDGLERRPHKPSLVDRALAQDLVDRFVAAGAEYVFVGPSLGLAGPRDVVRPLAHHDDHLHVRLPAP
jgi:murein endopeptidase